MHIVTQGYCCSGKNVLSVHKLTENINFFNFFNSIKKFDLNASKLQFNICQTTVLTYYCHIFLLVSQILAQQLMDKEIIMWLFFSKIVIILCL